MRVETCPDMEELFPGDLTGALKQVPPPTKSYRPVKSWEGEDELRKKMQSYPGSTAVGALQLGKYQCACSAPFAAARCPPLAPGPLRGTTRPSLASQPQGPLFWGGCFLQIETAQLEVPLAFEHRGAAVLGPLYQKALFVQVPTPSQDAP